VRAIGGLGCSYSRSGCDEKGAILESNAGLLVHSPPVVCVTRPCLQRYRMKTKNLDVRSKVPRLCIIKFIEADCKHTSYKFLDRFYLRF
jgi:hypothetical protein